jgi:hypothetical protein
LRNYFFGELKISFAGFLFVLAEAKIFAKRLDAWALLL